ncbi:MAG: aminotransferase class I/II-fold pyridoxal phosphate-dependent enzyme [Kiritimatiellae bacterium]|nr:aminotransferase class I/II-fold pyridoxal phosphate-dependent enzyme [Kiritimatiellia bacterium]
MSSPRSRIAAHVRDIPRSGIRDFFDIVSTMKDIISLGIGEPDFDTPWHIREAAIAALERGSTSYTSNLGLLSLRQAIARYGERVFNIHYKPENEILVTVGVSEALDLALRAIIEPGDEILYHEPCYVSYAPVVIFAHGKPVAVETRAEDGFRLTRAQLEAKVTPRTKALLLNFPNNPTGAILEPHDLREIADFAIQHDLIVLSDDIYAELTYDGRHTTIASLPGMKERCIFLHGFSKAWAMTGFRMAYACSTPELIEAMMKIHQYTMLCASIISQEASVEALTDADADVEEMRAEYQRRRNFLHNSFKEMGLPCHQPRGAFYAFPYIGHFGLTSKEFALRFLDAEKVAVVPGTAFGECGEGFIRCAYATGMEDLQEAMRRLARFIHSLQPNARPQPNAC